MEFIDLIKNSLDKKHSELLNGTSENIIKNIDINTEKALKEYSSFKERLKKENESFNKGIEAIKKNEKNRKNEEECARAKAVKERAEKECLERQREAQRQLDRRLKKRKRQKAAERFFQVASLFGPAIIVIVSAIILFWNTTQLRFRGTFVWWCTGWVFFLAATIVLTIVFAKKIFDDWDVEDTAARVTSVLFAVATIAALIVTICVSSANIESNFNPTTLISIKAEGKTTSESRGTFYTVISFSLKNTSDIDVDSISGNMDFYSGGSLLSKYTVTFYGTFYAGESYTSEVKFTEDSDYAYLYNASFSSLTIKWKMTSIYANGCNCSVDGSTVNLK